MMTEYDTLKIEYSEEAGDKFRILLINEENIVTSDELTSLDAARIHHVLINIESRLRYDMKFSTEELSGTAPLLTIDESRFALYINRLELYEQHDDALDFDIFYFPFRSFNDIDKIINYFAEAQY